MDSFPLPEWQNDEEKADLKNDSVSQPEQATPVAVPATDPPLNVNQETETAPLPSEEKPAVVQESAEHQEEPAEVSELEPAEDALLPASEGSDKVLKELSEIGDKLNQMQELFEKRIAHTEYEEKIVDQMHAELQKYKEDMYSQLVRPILLDIIEIRESIRRVSDSYATKPEGEQSVPLKTFADYRYDLQDLLEKNCITIYDSKEGEDFTPTKHRVIKKITTPVEDLQGKIAESLSSGYEYLGKTISPERVVVYVYQKIEKPEGENNNG